MKKKVQFSGFTLIELIVSSTIFIVVSTIIIGALFAALRLSKKSELFISASQNGNVAMAQIVRSIKYAKNLTDPTECLVPEATSEITVISSSDDGQTTFSCPTEDSPTIASNGASLIDTNQVTVQACHFTCSQSALNAPPVITIQFTLSNNVSGSNFVESAATIPFQTSVTMRNFTQ